ncbi:DUF2946 family protein [Rhodoblastus sp.]|uniref:DUF2946 family protein n=1 Tax=Rhodoblastus sp. TaxID=1962975 RepID=UPI003F99B57C
MFDGGKNRAISGRSAFAYAFVFLFAFQTFVASALMARTSSANASGIDAQIELSICQGLFGDSSKSGQLPGGQLPIGHAAGHCPLCVLQHGGALAAAPEAGVLRVAVARLILVLDIPQRDFRIAAFLEKGWASSWSAQAPPFNA